MITGHTTLADWAFLIATILALVVVVAFISPSTVTPKLRGIAGGLALALIAFGFWAL